MKNQRRILLCSPCWNIQNGKGVELLDLYTTRLTRGQGIFTQSGYCPYIALHLLAQNIDIPATVLEYPTEEAFLKEIRQGYDWIGITFSAIDTVAVIRMCAQIREYSPYSQIVVGGCGVPALKEALTVDSSLQPAQHSDTTLVDFLCEGEGIGYLRSLLGQPAIPKIRQNIPPSDSGFSWLPYDYQVGNIVSGLGCPNQCFFCSTSHFYQGRYIKLADTRTIFEHLKRQWREHPRLRMASIFDEDFFRNKSKVMKLGELIRSDRDFGLRKLNYVTFGSLLSLQQYSPEELVLSGVSAIWIGVESLFSQLKKLGHHRTKQIFDSLHEHGIATIGSWIVGLDVQESDNIDEDLEAFIQLQPILAQISLLTPMSGTPLWESLKKNQRLKEDFDWSRAHLYALNFLHPELDEETCLKVVERGHNELNARCGPTVLRDFWVHLNGLRFCLNSGNRFLREDKAACHRRALGESFAMLKSIGMFASNPSVQKSVFSAIDEYQRLVGPISWRLNLAQLLVPFKARCAHESGSEPCVPKPLTRKYQYNKGKVKLTFPGKPEMRFGKAGREFLEKLLYLFLGIGKNCSRRA